MNSDAVAAWLQAHAGLDAAALGADTIARALRARLAATGCVSAGEYVARLEASADERTALIDGVVVPETWFFRDRPALDALVRHVVQVWGPAHPGTVFRLLSVPCATGEEPYSLVMAFAAAGWPAERLRLEAVDISRRSLEGARRGEYGRNSFRGDDLSYRAAFLEFVDGEVWRVTPRVRTAVTFLEGNLLAEDFLADRPPYDAIFCRNLLIYFDRRTQARAGRTLARLLAPDGWLAVGPAEPVLLLAQGFELMRVRGAFLLRRGPGGANESPPPAPAPAWSGSTVPWRELARPPAAPLRAAPGAAELAPVGAWAEVRQLADAGRLDAARRRGEALLAGAGAAELCLLGVVAEAAGEAARAEELFRKVLYLEPGHAEALAHLAARLDLKGDHRAAQALRERARRAQGTEAE
jgi:chemotaxis protein methyltransferase WspC